MEILKSSTLERCTSGIQLTSSIVSCSKIMNIRLRRRRKVGGEAGTRIRSKGIWSLGEFWEYQSLFWNSLSIGKIEMCLVLIMNMIWLRKLEMSRQS